MSKSRMSNKEVVRSDAFLDMPDESQNFYFQVNMDTDDDGFVSNLKSLQRMLGVGDDSIKILILKKFIIQFENGIYVVKHFRINNFIRKDRYKETKYIKHKLSLYIRPNGAYTLRPEGAFPVPKGHFIIDDLVKNVSRLTTGQPKLNKVKLNKIKEKELDILDFVNKKAWNDFIEHRKEKKKVITQRAANLIFKKFKDVNQRDQQKMVDLAIENNWTTIYPLKKEFNNSSREVDYRSEKIKDEQRKQDNELLSDSEKQNPRIAEIMKKKRELSSSKVYETN